MGTPHIHSTYALHIYTPHIHSTYILHIYTPHGHSTYTLHICTPHIYSTYTLHIYTPHIYSTYILHIYTPHIYSTYILHIYTPHPVTIHFFTSIVPLRTAANDISSGGVTFKCTHRIPRVYKRHAEGGGVVEWWSGGGVEWWSDSVLFCSSVLHQVMVNLNVLQGFSAEIN